MIFKGACVFFMPTLLCCWDFILFLLSPWAALGSATGKLIHVTNNMSLVTWLKDKSANVCHSIRLNPLAAVTQSVNSICLRSFDPLESSLYFGLQTPTVLFYLSQAMVTTRRHDRNIHADIHNLQCAQYKSQRRNSGPLDGLHQATPCRVIAR